MEKKGYKRCKNLMIFFNTLFLLGGMAITGLGIWIVVDFASFSATLQASSLLFQYAAYIAIGVGGLTMFISILGCIGALKEIKCLLVIFIVILCLLIIAELGIVVLAFAFTAQFQTLVAGGALLTIQQDYGTTSTFGVGVTQAWDTTQGLFKCCGYNAGEDYTGSFYASTNSNTRPWPLSCCALSPTGGYVDSAACVGSPNVSPTNTYALTGCSASIQNLVTMYATWIGGVSAGVLLLQILAVTFACCVSSNIGKHNRVDTWS